MRAVVGLGGVFGIVRFALPPAFLLARLLPGPIVVVIHRLIWGLFDDDGFVVVIDGDRWKAEPPGRSLGAVVEFHEGAVDGTAAAGDVPGRLQDALTTGTPPDASHVEVEPDAGTLDGLILPFVPLRAPRRDHYHARPSLPCTDDPFSGLAPGRASPSRLSRDFR